MESATTWLCLDADCFRSPVNWNFRAHRMLYSSAATVCWLVLRCGRYPKVKRSSRESCKWFIRCPLLPLFQFRFFSSLVLLRSQNHFLSDRNRRNDRLLKLNKALCHCSACEGEYETLAELTSLGTPFACNLIEFPDTHVNSLEIVAVLNFIFNYLNRNIFLPYMSREMGWCVQSIIRLLRRMVHAHDADLSFTEFSKFVKSF